MNPKYAICALLLPLALVATHGVSSDSFQLGGDVYRGDDDNVMRSDASRDAFIAGFSVELAGDVVQDAHAAGFDVNISGDIGGNLYAAGSNVEIDGKVGQDLTVSGFTVRLTNDAMVLGNARIAAGNVIINAPVAGSLLAAGGTIKLDEAVQGDARLTASDIKFGSDAVISGTLTYFAPDEIAIPTSVISPDRVVFSRMAKGGSWRDIKDTVDDSVPDFWPRKMVSRLTGSLVMLAFLLIISSVFLAFAPQTVERLRFRATEHAWRSIFYGYLGLSTLFGAIIVSAITIVGIPLVPFVVLALIVIWALGYLLGVYVIAKRIWHSFDISPDAVFANLLILASGLIAMVVVNFIPFFGWILNLGVLFFGMGAMTYAVMERMIRRHESFGPKALPEPYTSSGAIE